MAYNKDSRSIFDRYVNKILQEAGEGDVARSQFSDEPVDPKAQAEELKKRAEALNDAAKKYPGQKVFLQQDGTYAPASQADKQFTAVGDKSAPGEGFNAVTKDNPEPPPTETKTAAEVPATQQLTKTTTNPPTPEEIKQYGATGAELRQSSGGQFMSREDRTNQEKVDAILGKGKYKAGSAEANLALADYFKKNPISSKTSAAVPPSTTQPLQTVNTGRPGQPVGSISTPGIQSTPGYNAEFNPTANNQTQGSSMSLKPSQPSLSDLGIQVTSGQKPVTTTPAPVAPAAPTSTTQPPKPKNRAEAATLARNRNPQPKSA